MEIIKAKDMIILLSDEEQKEFINRRDRMPNTSHSNLDVDLISPWVDLISDYIQNAKWAIERYTANSKFKIKFKAKVKILDPAPRRTRFF